RDLPGTRPARERPSTPRRSLADRRTRCAGRPILRHLHVAHNCPAPGLQHPRIRPELVRPKLLEYGPRTLAGQQLLAWDLHEGALLAGPSVVGPRLSVLGHA